MRLLLDTQALIWHSEENPALGQAARDAINNEDNERFISLASIWEMNIKAGTGKLKLPVLVPDIISRYKAEGVKILSIKEAHTHAVRTLPSVHRDPFDRMLVSQARYEALTLVTADERIRLYPVAWLW